MIQAWKLLFASRKFWIGTITVFAIAAASALVALGKLSHDQLAPTIAGITSVGITAIGSIAWEDGAKGKDAPAPAPAVPPSEEVTQPEIKAAET